MAPQIDMLNNQEINVDDVAALRSKSDSLSPQTSEPAMTAGGSSEDNTDHALDVEDNAPKGESSDDSKDDSEYNDFVEFVDFLDYLKAPPEYADFLDFLKASPMPKEEASVSVDFLDFLKSDPKPEEDEASEKDDWASLLDGENEEKVVQVEEIPLSGIMEGTPKASEDSTKDDDLDTFIASLTSKQDSNNNNPATKADFDEFVQFLNSLSTDEKAIATRSVQGGDNNKESAEAIWSDILTGMHKGATPGDIPQSWFGYFCEVFTQSLTKVQPAPEKGNEVQMAPVVTMV